MPVQKSLQEQLQAPNHMHNSTIAQARRLFEFYVNTGLAVTDIVAIPTLDGANVAQPISVDDLQALGQASDLPLNWHFRTKAAHEGESDKFENVAQTLLLIRGSNPIGAFTKIFAVRHPGRTTADAILAFYSNEKIAEVANKAIRDAGLYTL